MLDRAGLMGLRVADLKDRLRKAGVNFVHVVEKKELVDLLIASEDRKRVIEDDDSDEDVVKRRCSQMKRVVVSDDEDDASDGEDSSEEDLDTAECNAAVGKLVDELMAGESLEGITRVNFSVKAENAHLEVVWIPLSKKMLVKLVWRDEEGYVHRDYADMAHYGAYIKNMRYCKYTRKREWAEITFTPISQ